LTDLFATLASVTGAPWSGFGAEDSFDVWPILRGAELEQPVRDHAVHHSLAGHFALRAGRWKLIRRLGSGGFTAPKRVKPEPGGPEGQLYDLVNDPAETANLWSERQDVARDLAARLTALYTAGGSR
jgi:arylsulfatase A-like enzyme